MDRLRAYRCWLAKRMAVILPCLLCALVALVRFSLEPAPVAVRVLCVSLTGLILAVLGYFGVQAVLSMRHRGAAARLLRSQVRPYAGVSLALLVLLAGLLLAPELLREEPRTAPTLVYDPVRPEVSGAGSRPDANVAPRTRIVPRPEEGAPPEELLADVPLTLKSDPVPERSTQEDGAQDTPEDLRKKEAPRLDDLLPPDDFDWHLARRGLPPEGRPDLLPPPEVRLEVQLFWEDDEIGASGVALEFDYPISKMDAIRASLLAVSFGEGDASFEEPSVEWGHAVVELFHRLTGYTANAVFDFALGVGLSADVLRMEGVDTNLALAPYVSLEAAIWPVESFGLVLQIGQSVPVNVTGASVSITDVRLFVRWDISDTVSIHAGYRMVRARISDYDRPFSGAGGDEDLDETFQGPMIGVDIRF